MAAPNRQVVKRMRKEGFIPLAVAARRSKVPRTTISNWIATHRVQGTHAGYFVFVSRASLREQTGARV